MRESADDSRCRSRGTPPSDLNGAPGVTGIMYDSQLDLYTNLGGVLHVFALD